MKALLKKEFLLCAHPTCFVFLLFSAFVFIPNYPYEVMFFFSGLSAFFVALSARENGDAAFTASLPVEKGKIAVARILMCAVFQVSLLLLAGITTLVKELCFPLSAQINYAGTSANLAFLGYGALLLGVFNLIFYPLHWKNPKKAGIPFLLASLAEFLLIAVFIALRFALPLCRDGLCAPDPVSMAGKAVVFAVGIVAWAAFTVLACIISAKLFRKVNL